MRNSHNITIAESDTFNADDETIWSLPGPWSVLWRGCWRWAFHVLCMALTRCFSSSIPPFFLALLPVAIVAGIALHSLLKGRLFLSITSTLLTVGLMFGALFMWLLG